MSRGWRPWVLVVLVAGAFAWGVLHLFHAQFASGDVYPEFSSLRTDRMGTKLLYDSLARLPGVTVERNLLPMEFLPREGAVLLLLGAQPLAVNWNEAQLLQAAERYARRGNRVVLAMHFVREYHSLRQRDFDRREEPPAGRRKKKTEPETPAIQAIWGVSLKFDEDEKAPHPLYFGSTAGWIVRSQMGGRTLGIERQFDKGSVRLLAESGDFANGAVLSMQRLPQVTEALGDFKRVVFDEQHLGIAESGSVVGMARQFRLMGVVLGLGICALLFIWRNATSFPPPPSARVAERHAGRTSHSGLVTLLRRHIPTSEVAAVCWREWLSTNRAHTPPDLCSKAEAILASSAGRPLDAAREIQNLLRTKGEM